MIYIVQVKYDDQLIQLSPWSTIFTEAEGRRQYCTPRNQKIVLIKSLFIPTIHSGPNDKHRAYIYIYALTIDQNIAIEKFKKKQCVRILVRYVQTTVKMTSFNFLYHLVFRKKLYFLYVLKSEKSLKVQTNSVTEKMLKKTVLITLQPTENI